MERKLSVRTPIAYSLLVLIPALFGAQRATAAWVMDYAGELSPNLHDLRCLRPGAVSYDATGDEFCVTDAGARSFRVYSGRGIFSFATGTLAALSQPEDGALDAAGGFVFTDTDPGRGRRLCRLDLRGERVDFEATRPCAAWYPMHLLLTRDGGFVTVDNLNRLLCKHDEAGALLWSRELSPEAGDRELGLGRPAEAADGRLYLPSSMLHCIFVLDREGRLLDSFGRFGSARGRMILPVGVAMGPEGTVLVLDRLRHIVLLFGADHAFLGEYGSFGARPGQFYHPLSIAAAADGRVFVAQGHQGRIHRFRLYDTQAGASGSPAQPQSRLAFSTTATTMNNETRGWSHSASFADAPRIASPGEDPRILSNPKSNIMRYQQ